MSKEINRREFFKNTTFSAAGIMLGSNLAGCALNRESAIPSYDLMKEVMKYRKIDAHAHVGLYGPLPEDADLKIEAADRLGIEFLSISLPVTPHRGPAELSHEVVRRYNDIIMQAVKLYPDRFVGFFTLIPTFAKESLEELQRCVDAGMSGFKGYLQVKINDPLYYPIIEKLIDLKMICLMHAYLGLGRGGYRTKYGNLHPNESTPEDFIDVAKRYPEAIFQWAHIGGGGDWEYQCKALKDYPNIYLDTSGSNNEANMVNFALKHLGEDRLFFGTDGFFHQGVSNIMSSDATESQKRKIFFDNYNNVLRKGGYHVD